MALFTVQKIHLLGLRNAFSATLALLPLASFEDCTKETRCTPGTKTQHLNQSQADLAVDVFQLYFSVQQNHNKYSTVCSLGMFFFPDSETLYTHSGQPLVGVQMHLLPPLGDGDVDL